ncbi:XRE family transcriptional regulator, partial [Clostridioides difficile]
DLYSLDLFGETIKGHRNVNPYEGETILNRHVDEDRQSLPSVPTIEGFEDLKGIG